MQFSNAAFFRTISNLSIGSQNSELEQCSPLIVLTETSAPSTSFLSPASTYSAESFEEVLMLDVEEQRFLQKSGASINGASIQDTGQEQTPTPFGNKRSVPSIR